MLIPFPFAYLFGAACIDVWARAADRRDWMRTAKHMRMLGIGSALVAAVPGIIDYFTAVPPKSSAKGRATNHALANLSAFGLFAAAGAGEQQIAPASLDACRGSRRRRALAIAGWMGGTLVYRNQIAVDHRYAEAGRWEPKTLPPAPDDVALDVGPDDQLQVDQMKLLSMGDRRLVLARTEQVTWRSTTAAHRESAVGRNHSPAVTCSAPGTARSSTSTTARSSTDPQRTPSGRG